MVQSTHAFSGFVQAQHPLLRHLNYNLLLPWQRMLDFHHIIPKSNLQVHTFILVYDVAMYKRGAT